jgi:hypothetical protein
MLGLARYLEHGIGGVEGWLSPTTASMIAEILLGQTESDVGGDVCEIGVHHGRLFLILANAAAAGETAVAVDVFGDQEKNVDQSGRGDRAVFERNVALYAPAARVEILQESSLDLHCPSFLERRFRFMSIDGGHTAEATANDLWLAERTLAGKGVAALDDILSSMWTGVITGLMRYQAEGGALVPWALVPNKVFLARRDAVQHWQDFLRTRFPLALAKRDLEFPGGVVDSFNEHPYYDREAQIGLRRERDDMARQRDAAAAALAAVHRSTSWRVTAPLRSFRKFSGKV